MTHETRTTKPTALVTGASSGIGREVAVRLSGTHRLVLHGRDTARLQETKALCRASSEHLLWESDLRAVGSIAPALERLIADSSWRIDALVHGAGVFKLLPFRSLKPKLLEEMMAVNFAAAVEIARTLISKPINQTTLRSVVFVSSTASEFGVRGGSAYCASKGALDALMRALAVELAPGVRVNSVVAGAVRTPMTEKMLSDEELAKRLQAGIPLGIGHAGDIAAAVLFLLSEDARWITGHQLVVDGGQTVDITA